MPPRARSLSDGHDHVDGAIVGTWRLAPPPPGSGEWGHLRFAHDVLRECAVVVSYVADAEAARGFEASAEHYRKLWHQAGDALPGLRRVAFGTDRLPMTLLDDVRLGFDRLSAAVEELVRLGRDGHR